MSVINEFGFPFTSVSGDRVYSSQDWQDYFGTLVKSGLIQNSMNECEVKPQAIPNKTVFVDTGTLVINGVMRILETPVNLQCEDNVSGNPRIDRAVARLNVVSRQIEFAVKQGTPAVSPVAPALTRNETVWELGLADINLANGYSTITGTEITDQRSDVDLCGASSMTIGVIPPKGLDAVTVQLEPETQAMYGVENVDDALKRAIVDFSSYQAFCSNVNADSINSALGKNNEDLIHGMGLQLSMYAWYKGSSKTAFPFNVLKNQDLITDVLSTGRDEVKSNEYTMDLLVRSYLSTESSKLLSNYPLITGIGEGENGEFLIGLSNGKVCKTSDFITFTTPVSVASNTRAVTVILYEPQFGKYICRTTHDIFYSTNFSTWISVANYNGVNVPRADPLLFRKVIGADRYYSTWWDNGYKGTITSTNGTNWTSVTGIDSSGITMFIYKGGIYYGFADKSVYSSLDGVTFTLAATFTNISVKGITLKDGYYYVRGTGGIYKSNQPQTEATYILANDSPSAKLTDSFNLLLPPFQYVPTLYGKSCDLFWTKNYLFSGVGAVTPIPINSSFCVGGRLINYTSSNLYEQSNRLID